MSAAHQTYEWRRLARLRVQHAEALGEACWRCGEEIDYSLPGNDPRGPTADHTTPLGAGGELLPMLDELKVSHLSCNSRHGSAMAAAQGRTRKRRRSWRSAQIW